MSINQPQRDKVSYATYLTWPDEPRYEIIDGIPYLQAVPSRHHQLIVTRLTGEFYNFLKGKDCEVYTSPFDVRLSATIDEKEYNVVQPDVSVICDKNKLDEKGCNRAPDIIVEVLSPSTWQRDRIEKLNQYQKYGVKEYLLVYPNENIIEQYILGKNGSYNNPNIYKKDDLFQSHLFPTFEIPLNGLFN